MPGDLLDCVLKNSRMVWVGESQGDGLARTFPVNILLCVGSRSTKVTHSLVAPVFVGGTGSASCDSASGAWLGSWLPRVGPRDSESALIGVRICQQLEGRLIKFMNDTKLG